MKKLLGILMVLFTTTLSVNAKCDWSTLKLQEWNQSNYYKFYATGAGIGDDTCINWIFTVYDHQQKKLDTVRDFTGYIEVAFNNKGKYTVNFKIWNSCLGCDTLISREVNLIYFNNCKFNYKMLSSSHGSCLDSISGTMSLAEKRKGDTCWEYYFYIYHGPELDSLSQTDWDSMSDQQLYNYYSFSDSDLLVLEGPANKPINYKFTGEGHYLLATQWYNKCLGQDTFFFTRITIELCNLMGVKNYSKPDPKLIEIYDMMGRRVYHIRRDEILIYLYDDGSTKKVIVH